MKMFRSLAYVPLWVMAALLASCSQLPVINPLDPAGDREITQRCRRPFPDAPHRFVHAIETGVAGRAGGTVFGVTLFDPLAGTVHSALLTLEGFVLFEARQNRDVQVNRAVPPFDKPHFAQNMMADIRLMFLAPPGRPLKSGILEDGAAICRYDGGQGRTLDVVVHQDDSWELGLYGDNEEPLRRVKADAVRNGIPERIELTGFFSVNYVLRMRLISAEPILPETLHLKDE